MLVGYARVSTHDQNLDLQRDALAAAGCDKIVVDQVSGAKKQRTGLDRVLDTLREGDTLVVWRLDRLGRSLKHLIELVGELEGKGVAFRSLQESIDTTSPGGRLVFHIFGALAEFERNLIQERTQAGLAAAKARGRKGGRPKSLNAEKRKMAVKLFRRAITLYKSFAVWWGCRNPRSTATCVNQLELRVVSKPTFPARGNRCRTNRGE